MPRVNSSDVFLITTLHANIHFEDFQYVVGSCSENLRAIRNLTAGHNWPADQTLDITFFWSCRPECDEACGQKKKFII